MDSITCVFISITAFSTTKNQKKKKTKKKKTELNCGNTVHTTYVSCYSLQNSQLTLHLCLYSMKVAARSSIYFKYLNTCTAGDAHNPSFHIYNPSHTVVDKLGQPKLNKYTDVQGLFITFCEDQHLTHNLDLIQIGWRVMDDLFQKLLLSSRSSGDG